MDTLLNNLKKANLIDVQGNIILEIYDAGFYQSVDIETFKSFFGGTDYSYNQLVAADQGRGYTRFFDSWKSSGILS